MDKKNDHTHAGHLSIFPAESTKQTSTLSSALIEFIHVHSVWVFCCVFSDQATLGGLQSDSGSLPIPLLLDRSIPQLRPIPSHRRQAREDYLSSETMSLSKEVDTLKKEAATFTERLTQFEEATLTLNELAKMV